MNNKQTLKRNIITGHILADFYKDEDYPVDLLEICLEQSRNNSNFDKLGKIELEAITDRILKIVQTNTMKSDIGFGTIRKDPKNVTDAAISSTIEADWRTGNRAGQQPAA